MYNTLYTIEYNHVYTTLKLTHNCALRGTHRMQRTHLRDIRFHWIGPWMLVGPMGVPHICTIILGGYLLVRLVGDIAHTNHCCDS